MKLNIAKLRKALTAMTPTSAQAKAGNYKKGHTSFNGLNLTIENPAGTTRTGVDRNGKPWATLMRDHYGYIKAIKGKDGDNLDIFISETPVETAPVFIIDQHDNVHGGFDEHKIMLGYATQAEAQDAYLRNFDPAFCGLKDITPMAMDVFKEMISSGSLTAKVAKRFKISKLKKALKEIQK